MLEQAGKVIGHREFAPSSLPAGAEDRTSPHAGSWELDAWKIPRDVAREGSVCWWMQWANKFMVALQVLTCLRQKQIKQKQPNQIKSDSNNSNKATSVVMTL